jgi:hypothetical protein
VAPEVITKLREDIDGSDATQTLRSALDGVEYEIDLSDRNANRLRNRFQESIRHARKVGGGRGYKAATSTRVEPT